MIGRHGNKRTSETNLADVDNLNEKKKAKIGGDGAEAEAAKEGKNTLDGGGEEHISLSDSLMDTAELMGEESQKEVDKGDFNAGEKGTIKRFNYCPNLLGYIRLSKFWIFKF